MEEKNPWLSATTSPIYMHGTFGFYFIDGIKKHETEKIELMTKQAILEGNIMKQSAEAHGTIK